MEALLDDLATRVQDDGVADSLTGSSGSDWYFAHTSGEADELDAQRRDFRGCSYDYLSSLRLITRPCQLRRTHQNGV